MDGKLLSKLLDVLYQRYGESPNMKALEEIWVELLTEIPDGAYAEAKRRLITETQRLPNAGRIRRVLKEEGEKCRRRDYAIRKAMEGRRVERPARMLSEEEYDVYHKRAVEANLAQGEHKRELLEGLLRDYPGFGWEIVVEDLA